MNKKIMSKKISKNTISKKISTNTMMAKKECHKYSKILQGSNKNLKLKDPIKKIKNLNNIKLLKNS